MRVESAFRAAGHSHPGLQRSENEDRLHYDAARGIFIVVDGVGGHAAGERAAETAIAMLRARLERETGPVEDRVREAIAIANNEIHRRASLRPEWKGMACVLTVAVVDDGRAVVGHVGDTRLYKLRRGQIEKVTRDHSPVGEREDARELSEAEAMRHPRRNEVYRDVGSEPHEPTDPEFIDLLKVPFEPDAALLLCSDGLTDAVSSALIGHIVHQYAGHPHEIVRALVDAANDAGGKDNVTVVYVEGSQFTSFPNPAAAPAVRREAVAPVRETVFESPRRGESGAARRWRLALLIVLLLAVAGAGAWRLGVRWPAGPSWPAWLRSPLSLVLPSRTVTVSASQSIAAAIDRAAPGTEIVVEPGQYRERVVLKSGVRVRSRVRGAAEVRLPSGASETDAAVLAADIEDAQLSGFRIVGDAATPLGVGVFVRNAAVVLWDVEITGAQVTAIEFAAGGGALLAADVHDNPGAGLTVRAGAEPRVEHNLFVGNGKSEHASGGIVIEAGARPHLAGNVFYGLVADSLTVLSPAERAAVKSANVFLASDEGASRRPSTSPGRSPSTGPGRGASNLRDPQGRTGRGRGAAGPGRAPSTGPGRGLR